MELDITTLSVLAGSLIPVLVGLVAKKVASSGLKGLLNALLSAIAAAVTVVTDAGEFVLDDFVTALFVTFVVSISTYYGVWKPTGVTEKVGDKTANFGIGG